MIECVVGKYKTVEEKLALLRKRMKSGEVIANRDIRNAFGERYVVYDKLQKAAVKYAKDYNRERNSNRSEAQQNVAKLIKQVLMLNGRGIDSSTAVEKACEAIAELDIGEREQLNYWERNKDTRNIEWDNFASLRNDTIYRETPAMRIIDVKQHALEEAIDLIIGVQQSKDEKQLLKDKKQLLSKVKQY